MVEWYWRSFSVFEVVITPAHLNEIFDWFSWLWQEVLRQYISAQHADCAHRILYWSHTVTLTIATITTIAAIATIAILWTFAEGGLLLLISLKEAWLDQQAALGIV